MPQIIIHTVINAPIQTCFDLARDVGFYCQSLRKPTEIPISGKISGLVDKGDYITWETNHINFIQHLTLKVTELESPFLFVDEMVKGEFKSYKHEHIFKTNSRGETIMTDKFYFESSYGVLGRIVDSVFLKRHFKGLIKTRNKLLKERAEATVF